MASSRRLPINDPFRAQQQRARSVDSTSRMTDTELFASPQNHFQTTSPKVTFGPTVTSPDQFDSSAAVTISTQNTQYIQSESTDMQVNTRNTDNINELLQKISTLSVGDNALTPKPFTGVKTDGDAVERWLDYFEQYSSFRHLDECTKLQLFKLLLAEQAADWLKTLEDNVSSDYQRLITAFKSRYALTDLQKWRKASSMWERDQKTCESVDTFITDIKRAAKQIPITDQNLVRFAVLKGLRPAIRLHVLQSKATTLNDVIDAARVAEAALDATKDVTDNTVSELTKQIAGLIDQLNQQPREQPTNMNELSSSQQSQWETVDAIANQSSRDRMERPPMRNSDNNASRTVYNRQQTFVNEPIQQPAYHTDNMRQYKRSAHHTIEQRLCSKCGTQHYPGQCIAYGAHCYNCGKVNHFSRCCRARNSHRKQAYFTQQQVPHGQQPMCPQNQQNFQNAYPAAYCPSH